MNLENYYACFDSIVPSRICDYIIEDAERQNEQTAIVGDYNEVPTNEKDIAKLYKTRNSSIVWMNDPWIYREIIPFVREANQFCNWNFDFHLSESCQFTKYSKSQHYTWHQDIGPGILSKRKISITVQLSDPSEYDGGVLEMWQGGSQDSAVKAYKGAGSVFIFPSYMMHRVTPVTRGIRKSFVLWVGGSHYK